MEKKTINEVERRSITMAVTLEKRAEDAAESRSISGYAAVYNSWSQPLYWFREMIAPGAFDKADMGQCILCFNHDSNKICARVSSGTLKLTIDDKGLRFDADLPNTTVGNDLLELIRRGDISQCSFAFRVAKDTWRYADEINGLELDERTIDEISEVLDVCPVVRPAYEDTSVDARSLEQRKAEHNAAVSASLAAAESESRARELELLTLKFQ
ncbi:MAG: HK97 family phage prohead protease [Bacteroidales bacterium]|nr:HK97 family phage prohead protease [Bacteroidales bacterium]